MIQQIIEEHNLQDILTIEDKRAFTPLIYEHVNPYGLFPLDLSVRLPHLTIGWLHNGKNISQKNASKSIKSA